MTVVLKPGREKSLLQRHPWIFSGAIAKRPEIEPGALCRVESAVGELLGTGYFHFRAPSLVGRMVSFGDEQPEKALTRCLYQAVTLRKELCAPKTDGYRLIHGEADGFPGLIVDRYGEVLVVQVGTLGMEKLKPFWLKLLIEELQPQAIFEKSTSHSRKEEGLVSFQALLYGTLPESLRIQEYGISMQVDVVGGQKTGLFLDQRQLRNQVRALAKGKRVLNLFSYTGGFTLQALAGGALGVDSVDISPSALAICRHDIEKNGLNLAACGFFCQDVFRFLESASLNYDLVILDPPAFAKKSKDVTRAFSAYKELNRLVISKMPTPSILVTASCSYHLSAAQFQQLLFIAAGEGKKRAKLISRHPLAYDHPIDLAHPESDYIKSALLYLQEI